ncbi:MAG: hypothetical protein A2539_08115 [Elusimicrobia bacterium RIFOXYD2_FULL_34_15]|nr:MAG: hypothetical protein A2539_08115 [Elusimicrobia bacterium RIFOXYD2_FULL_34_15]
MRKEVKTIVQWILYFLIIAIVGFVGLNRLIDALIHSKKDVIVPNLIGKNINDMLDTVSSLNLYIKKTGEDFNTELQAGLIISQSPVSGSVVKEGKAIKVIVSAGGEVIFVPDLTNQTIRSAQVMLRKNSLDLGEQDEKYSYTVEKGKIISQSPLARTSVRKDGLVNIIVSLGVPLEGTLLMPNFINKNSLEAEQWCVENGVIVKNTNMVSDPSIADNTIIKQMPEADAVINKGQSVEFWIASKPK